MFHNLLQVEKTAFVVYWVMNGIDWCQVGFVPWHLIKHTDKYNGFLAQVIDVYSTADDSNCRRQKLYKNHGFAKVVQILKFDTTKEAQEALFDATSEKGTKRSNNVGEETINRKKENAAYALMLLYNIMIVI